MKKVFLSLIVAIMATHSYAQAEYSIPEAIKATRTILPEEGSDSIDQQFRALMISANIVFHQTVFWLESEKQCMGFSGASEECNAVETAKFAAKNIAILLIAGGVMYKIGNPARRRAISLIEAVTPDGFKNALALTALKGISLTALFSYPVYLSHLANFSDERKEMELNELILAKKAVGRVNYSTVDNLLGSIGIGRYTLSGLIEDIQTLEATMAEVQ